MYKLKAFQAGEYFHQASENLIPDDWIENDDHHGNWFIPSIVNMAFSCELYLKSILSNGRDKICGHNLYTLYAKLPNNIKTQLQANTSGYTENSSFEETLKKNATIFEDWRYYFEEDKHLGVSILFLESFTNVLHDIAEKECEKFNVQLHPLPL